MTTTHHATTCSLCQLPTYHPLTGDDGALYCCPACREVSALLAAAPEASAPAAPAATDDVTLGLAGLWCPSCTWLIQTGLARAPGVVSAETSFLRREARVRFDPARTNPARLRRQVRRLGYRAWLDGDRPIDDEEAHWNRLLVGGALTMKIMVLAFILYVRQWLGLASADTEWLARIFELMMVPLVLVVIVVLGVPIVRAGLAGLLRGRPNTHTLIALGAGAAFALSVRNLLRGEGSVYFDTTAVLFFLMGIGRWLEMQAQKESQRAVAQLWARVPHEAAWLTPDGEQRVAADAVPLGTRVRVRPGERVPVDGIIADGRSDVDESWLTGEADPVARRAGDTVYAGTLALDGTLELITRAVGATTAVGQVSRLLHEASWQRAPVERLTDRLAAALVPGAAALAVLAGAAWGWARGVETGLSVALAVLLIACPCALGIATPLTLWLGLGRAAEAGVILRRTGVLEQLAQVQHVYFDKTGTLTTRQMVVQGAEVADSAESPLIFARIAAVETLSEHPLAAALATFAAERAGPPPAAVTDFRVAPGAGVTAVVDGTPVAVGNRALMDAHDLALPAALAARTAAWQARGWRVVLAGWGGGVRAALAVGETARAEAPAALAALRDLDVPATVLTGDDPVTGAYWQAQWGVPVLAGLRPDAKVAHIRAAGPGSAMVGDGINDGPALAASGVGLALRQGADVARSAADAVLLHDDLTLVPWLIMLARRTHAVVRANLLWALGYNAVGLALALSGQLQPAFAALIMVGSNVVVTRNALRLRRLPGHAAAPATGDTLPGEATPAPVWRRAVSAD